MRTVLANKIDPEIYDKTQDLIVGELFFRKHKIRHAKIKFMKVYQLKYLPLTDDLVLQGG